MKVRASAAIVLRLAVRAQLSTTGSEPWKPYRPSPLCTACGQQLILTRFAGVEGTLLGIPPGVMETISMQVRRNGRVTAYDDTTEPPAVFFNAGSNVKMRSAVADDQMEVKLAGNRHERGNGAQRCHGARGRSFQAACQVPRGRTTARECRTQESKRQSRRRVGEELRQPVRTDVYRQTRCRWADKAVHRGRAGFLARQRTPWSKPPGNVHTAARPQQLVPLIR